MPKRVNRLKRSPFTIQLHETVATVQTRTGPQNPPDVAASRAEKERVRIQATSILGRHWQLPWESLCSTSLTRLGK